jgi:serine/threonine protein kinase HipA of HipAB toxin-antitoxin module
VARWFSHTISNTDDHLRNHGFLYEGQAGWRLSPAYDLNRADRHQAAHPQHGDQ